MNPQPPFAHAARAAGIPPWTLAVAAMLLIQLSNALSVTVIDAVGAAGAAWLRMVFGAVLLFVIARSNLRALRWRDARLLVGLGIATGFMTTFFLSAVDRIPLGTAVAIEFLGPLTVAALWSRDRRALLWPGLALIGVTLLTEPWQGNADLAGIGFALLASVCWGTYIVLTQRAGDRFTGITALALTIPIAAIATAPVGVPQVVAGEATLDIVLLAAGIALITPVVSFALEMLALRRMHHGAFGTLMAIEPAFGVLIGLIILSQLPSLAQLAGIAIVVLAGIAAQRSGRREETGRL